jgi:hypothetical protein
MAGPTVQAVNDRMANSDPYVNIYVVTPFGNGNSPVTILGRLPFEILGVYGNGEIKARYMGGDDNYQIDPNRKIAASVTLKAEISWPAEIPYSKRSKKTYAVVKFIKY